MENENDFTPTVIKGPGIFYVGKSFNEELFEELYFGLQVAFADNNIQEITIYINSDGGRIDVVLPLYDLIQANTKVVRTIILGKACSAAAILAISGTKGYRLAYKHSQIMLHEASMSGISGKSSQVKETVNDLQHATKLMAEMIEDKTKISNKKIKKYFDSNIDYWIYSEEALKDGIIDKIL